MHPKWFIALGMIFVIGGLLGGLLEQQYLGSERAGVIYHLMTDYQEIEFTNPLILIGTFISVAWSYVQTLFAMLTFNFAFFYGNWQILRYLCLTIPIGIFASLLLAMRGTSSAG